MNESMQLVQYRTGEFNKKSRELETFSQARIRVLIALAVVFALVSCQSATEDKKFAVEEPVGRYQMMPQLSGKVNVVVLDTVKGTLQNCLLVNERYHCLAQTDVTTVTGGLPEPVIQ